MNPEDFHLAREVFADICDVAEAQQRAAIDERCAGRPEARRLVHAMLREDAADDFTLASATPPIDPKAVSAAVESAKLPASIGRYRIIRVCGHGGMGTVYEAEQDSPRRRVALKMIRSVSASREVLLRFRQEAEMLGRLQHPGIGQIFEAGSADLGDGQRPYFAMEFIEGQPLTTYANERGFPLRDRLELMARVCDAVHYAHQRGIIHRDLKPDNILVSNDATPDGSGTAIGQPKILDFGIARVTDSDVRNTMQTNVGQLIGTLQYMSPEQAAGDPAALDTRSDIYALGVLLYELLAGRLPYDLHEQSVPQSLRIIQENTPSTLSLHNSAYRGDVDTIVGKSLEKEPDRRYQSASELAEDIRRYMRDEPIAARPPSAFYQLRKFARRNRALVGGVVATIAALAVGVVVATVLAVHADRLAHESARSAAEARAQAYRASIIAAQGLMENDPFAALDQLEHAPPEHRNWEWRHLMHRLTSHLRDLEPGGPIAGRPALVEDGSVLAMRADGVVVRWEAEHPDARTVVATLGADVRSVAFSPGADRVAVVTADGAIRAHDLATNQPIEVPPFPGEGEIALAWREDGAQLVAGRRDRIGTWRANEEWTVQANDPAFSGAYQLKELFAVPGADRAVGLMIASDGSPIRVVLIEISTGRFLASHLHNENVLAMALSLDGKQIAVGYEFRSVRILDAETLTETARPGAHAGPVIGVSFSPDGKRLCSVGTDGTVRFWDLVGAGRQRVIQVDFPIHAMYSGDGAQLLCVAGSKDRRVQVTRSIPDVPPGATIRRWNLDSSGCTVLRGPEGYVYDLAYSPDGAQLVSQTYGGVIRLWDPHTGRLDRRIDGESLPMFRSDGTLVVRLRGGLAQVDPATGAVVAGPTLATTVLQHSFDEGRMMGAEAIKPSPAHVIWRTEYSATANDGFVLRAFADGALLADIPEGEQPDYAPGPVPLPLFVGPPAGSLYHDGLLAELLIFNGRLSNADTAVVERYLDIRRTSGGGDLPDTPSAALVAQFVADAATVTLDGEGYVLSWTATNNPAIVVRADGTTEASLRFDGTAMNGHPTLKAEAWCGRLEGTLPSDVRLGDTTVFWLGNHNGGAQRTAYSIGLGGAHDPGLQRELREILGDLHGLRMSNEAAFSPDGSLVAAIHQSIAATGGIALADAARDAPRTDRSAWRGRICGDYFCLAFHPNGRHIAAGSASGTIGIWDVHSREKVAELTGHHGIVYSVAYSPDGTRLVSGGNDTTVRLWDTARGTQVMALRGHEQYVKAVLFSPDGSQIASASGDGTVRLWDAPLSPESQGQ